ncbi:MAG: CsbD family protein [Vicinamibacterales bacterium]
MLHKDEVAGKAEQLKGKMKEKLGEFTQDPHLVEEGRDDQVEGAVKEDVGTAKRKVADAAERVADAVRRN